MSFSVCHCFSSSQSAYYFLNGQVQYIQSKGHNVSFAIPDDGFVEQLQVMFPTVELHIIPIVRNISPIQDLIALFSYIKLFKIKKFNIIHLHTPKAGLLGAMAGRMLNHRNIVFHLHGLVSLKWNKLIPGLTLLMEKVPFYLAHKVLCVSESLKGLCIDNQLISSEKISTLHHGSINGIDCVKRFNPESLKEEVLTLKRELKSNDKFVIGFLGRMNNDKGLLDIIDVANSLNTSIANLLVIFVGPNETSEDFNRFLDAKLNVPYKYFSRTNQPELYISLFDVMLFPSYREGFGLVTAEANALKVPVVTYDIAGIQDAVAHNETGILVKPGDIKALADAVKYYEKNPTIKIQHGINGRKRVERYFNPKSVWEAQLNFYNEFLSR